MEISSTLLAIARYTGGHTSIAITITVHRQPILLMRRQQKSSFIISTRMEREAHRSGTLLERSSLTTRDDFT